MRCRKHPPESPVGVCASCLRERLLNLLAQEEERRYEFTQSLHISPATFYEERASISEEQEADNLHTPLGILHAASERQSKSTVRDRNTNPEDKPNRLKRSLLGASHFWKSPDFAKSRLTDKRPVNEGFNENEVAGSSPWHRRTEHTFDEVLPHKRSSWIYSWLHRRKRKANHVEYPDQSSSVADKSFMTAVSSFEVSPNKNCSEDLDLFTRHHHALQPQLSPIQHNFRVFSPSHYVEQESTYFSNCSFFYKRGNKILNIFKKKLPGRSPPHRYRESENSNVDDCSQSGSIHHRNGLFHRHAKGASTSSVITEPEDDQRSSAYNRQGVTCNTDIWGSFPSPKAKVGKTERIQYNDCAGSFSPYVERRSMQSPKRFPSVSNQLSTGFTFCLSPLKKPGRKLYPQASV